MKSRLTAGLALSAAAVLTGCATGNISSPVTNHSISTNSITASNVSNPRNSTSTLVSSSQVYVTADTYTAKSQNVVYPQLHDLHDAKVQSKLNALLKETAIYKPTESSSEPSSYTYSSSYNVVFEQGDIMNIVYSSVFTPTGAAHGMPAHTSLILNLKTGQTYSLNDMFRRKSNYLQQISHVVQKEDKSHALDTFRKFTGVTSKDTMFLREGAFVVDFSPYEWASFAQGFIDYSVPLVDVENMVDTKSSMWTALNDSAGFPATDYRSKETAKIASLGYTSSLRPEYETTVMTANEDTLTAWVGTQKQRNTVSSGTNVFFFLNGKYLGTDTFNSHGSVKDVYPDGHGSIAVTYFNFSPTGDANPFTIHYFWDGSKLATKGTFPSGFGTSK